MENEWPVRCCKEPQGEMPCSGFEMGSGLVEVELSVARRHEMSLRSGLLYGCRARVKL